MSVVIGCAGVGARSTEHTFLFWILARRRAALLAAFKSKGVSAAGAMLSRAPTKCITDVSMPGECCA